MIRGEGFEEMTAPTAGEQVWVSFILSQKTGCVPILIHFKCDSKYDFT